MRYAIINVLDIDPPDKVNANPSEYPSSSPTCLKLMVTSGCWSSTYHWKAGTKLMRPQILSRITKR